MEGVCVFPYFKGLLDFGWLLKKESLIGFYILVSAAVFRWAAIIQGIFSSSDELKVSLAMDIPSFSWPLLIAITFLGMVFYSSKKLNFPIKNLTKISLSFLLATYLYILL